MCECVCTRERSRERERERRGNQKAKKELSSFFVRHERGENTKKGENDGIFVLVCHRYVSLLHCRLWPEGKSVSLASLFLFAYCVVAVARGGEKKDALTFPLIFSSFLLLMRGKDAKKRRCALRKKCCEHILLRRKREELTFLELRDL